MDFLRRIGRASIWSKDAIPVEEWKYRNFKRVVLPVYDLLVVLAGGAAVVWGMPSFEQIFPGTVVDAIGWTLVIVAVVCLLGVSFPRLWAVEILGKAILFGIIVAYLIALAGLALQGVGTREFVMVVVSMTLPIPVFRMGMLGTEIRDRRDNDDDE